MITAKEAREQSVEVLKSNELSEIEKQITSAIQQGYFSVTVYRMSDATKSALKELGYTVDHYMGDYQSEENWDICW